MAESDLQHLRLARVNEVVLVEIVTRDVQTPTVAQEIGAEFARVTAQDWAKRLVVDFHQVRYLCSTGFAVLVKLVKQFTAAGGQIKFCNMNADVRIGAGIIGLEHIVEIHDTEAAALVTFSQT